MHHGVGSEDKKFTPPPQISRRLTYSAPLNLNSDILDAIAHQYLILDYAYGEMHLDVTEFKSVVWL